MPNKHFITSLAVEGKVAASTQNQAFNDRELGGLRSLCSVSCGMWNVGRRGGSAIELRPYYLTMYTIASRDLQNSPGRSHIALKVQRTH